MRNESRLFLGITAFFVVIGIAYWFLAYEESGAVMLAGAAGLGLFAGGYLTVCSRRMAPRPEDRPDASLADGAGLVDEFPTASVWPIGVALGGTILATGLVFGLAVVLIGGGLLLVTLVGLVLQSRFHGAGGSGHQDV